MNQEPSGTASLRSEFADDPDMNELVVDYVSSMPQRINSMLSAFERCQRAQLIRIVHQLKGSSGCYGFPQLTAVADRLERKLSSIADQDVPAVDPELRALVELCERMAA